MPATPSKIYIEEFQDFAGFDVQTTASQNWRATVATGGVITVQTTEGGFLRMALTNAATAAGTIGGSVQYRPDYLGGPMTFLARVRASNAGKASIFVGFTDANNDTPIIEDEDGTLNTVAANAVGVLLEGEQNLKWQGVSVKGNADGAQIVIGNQEDVQNSEWHEVGVTVNRDGGVYFMVDGQNSPVYDGVLDSDTEYCWAVGSDGRGTAYNVEVDYVSFCATRRQR